MKDDAFNDAFIHRLEEGMNLRMSGHRHRECMRGAKWVAAWSDGTTFTTRSRPQATKPLMISIAKRWPNPPMTLTKEGGQSFMVENLESHTDSFVDLFRLLKFEDTARGACYFKNGKATSTPSRIKQFGPCELIAYKVHSDSRAALKREKKLHQQFAALRGPESEIFLLKAEKLQQVVNTMVVPG